MTDRERRSGVAAHLHGSARQVPVLTLWERVSLRTCLTGGGKLTHSLCKQAHMAIITLIFGGGAGEMQEDRAGGTRQKRKVGMERAKKGAPWFFLPEDVYVEPSQGPTQFSGKPAEAPPSHAPASPSSSEQRGCTTPDTLMAWSTEVYSFPKEQDAEFFTVFGAPPFPGWRQLEDPNQIAEGSLGRNTTSTCGQGILCLTFALCVSTALAPT